MRNRKYLITAFIIICYVTGGCGVQNPVAEISVTESGIAVSQSLGPVIAATDWPGWRGPSGDGIVAAQSLPTQWNEQTNIRWRTEIPGRGHSSPIVFADTVYLATADDDNQRQMVMAFDRQSGSPQWTTTVHEGGFPPKKQVHAKATNANGTIACDGRRLYVSFLNSDAITATAIDLDGNIAWQQELGKFTCRFGYAPSPVLYKSLVIFTADNQGGGYLAAVDADSGTIAWRVKRGTIDNYSSPVVARVGGQDQLLISGCGAVASYDPATGEQKWRTECISEATCGTVVTTDNLILASGGFPDKETVCLSADGKRIWSNETKVYEPSMVVSGDSLVAVSDDGVAYCWGLADGQSKWRQRLGGNFSASPIVCGENIYASNLKGDTFVFRAGDHYAPVARNSLGNDCYASPAVSAGQIFLRVGVGTEPNRREQLVCIAEPE